MRAGVAGSHCADSAENPAGGHRLVGDLVECLVDLDGRGPAGGSSESSRFIFGPGDAILSRLVQMMLDENVIISRVRLAAKIVCH